jgi:hypothetical protein
MIQTSTVDQLIDALDTYERETAEKLNTHETPLSEPRQHLLGMLAATDSGIHVSFSDQTYPLAL